MRTCSKCGWVYPSSYTRTKCKFCGHQFELQICVECKQLVPTNKFYTRSDGRLTRRCPDCNKILKYKWAKENPDKHNAGVRRFMDKRLDTAEDELEGWLKKVGGLPTESMTESQWLETCRYFKGCAICGNEHIEVRGFFIPFEEGGTYSVWNMLPLCGVCAAGMPKAVGNPFKWFDKYYGNAEALGLNEHRKERLLEYLTGRLEYEG